MKNLMSNEKECYMCHTTEDLHKHHVFFGNGRRRLSEQDGCWCYLCARHHNMSDLGVHFNKDLDNFLKRVCQKKWEMVRGTRADFIKRFGRNYLG